MTKVAIIGYGWVGKAMHKLFPEAVIYSHNKYLDGSPIVDWEKNKEKFKQDVNNCDVAFICVPTPNLILKSSNREDEEMIPEHIGQGRLDTSIVDECISWIKCPLIVIRSTVNPGDCDRWAGNDNPLYKWQGKNIVYQPEYLGETPNHPLLDTTKRKFLVIGGDPENRRKLIELYQTVYNANVNIRQVTLLEAEIIKLSENRAIVFKVAQCQELYDVCKKAGVDYYIIREAVYSDDPRFNLWWTFVFPDKRGFNSKCIPKDIYAWCAWAESLGYEPKITRAILEKNKEWIGGEENA